MIPVSGTSGKVPDDIHKTEYSEIQQVHPSGQVVTAKATSQEHSTQPNDGNNKSVSTKKSSRLSTWCI